MGFYKTTVTNRKGEIVETGGIQSIFLHGVWHEISQEAISAVGIFIEQSHRLPVFNVLYLEPDSKGGYMLQSKIWSREQPEEKFKEHLTVWVMEKLTEGCKFDFRETTDKIFSNIQVLEKLR